MTENIYFLKYSNIYSLTKVAMVVTFTKVTCTWRGIYNTTPAWLHNRSYTNMFLVMLYSTVSMLFSSL